MNNKKELAYFITLFKLEGHETWRASLKSDPNGLDKEVISNKMPKVTERKVYKVDRITGEISLQ